MSLKRSLLYFWLSKFQSTNYCRYTK